MKPTDAQVAPRKNLTLWHRPSLGDGGIVAEVFDWDVYRINPAVRGTVAGIRGAVVVDLGAHIGAVSTYCAYLGAREVYAVEPEPDNLRLLRANAKPWKAITVIHAAVGATSGETYVAGESATAHTLGAEQDLEGSRFLVRQMTLPELLDEHRLDRVDLLKADCEGAEMAMLVACDHEHLGRIKRIAMSVGALVEHLLHTHHVDVGGIPDQWGQLHAERLET